MSKLPLRRTRKYRNARCQVHPYVREKFYRTYQRTMGKSYWPLLFTSGEVTRKLLLSESTGWTRGGGGGWVLRISSHGNDRMRAKLETQKKSLRLQQEWLQAKPKKFPDEFPESRKGYNTKKTKGSQDTRVLPRYHESSDCFEYPKKSPLKSSHPKKYLPNFPSQNKIPESKISNLPQKSFDHPRHLNSVVPPPPPTLLGVEQTLFKGHFT